MKLPPVLDSRPGPEWEKCEWSELLRTESDGKRAKWPRKPGRGRRAGTREEEGGGGVEDPRIVVITSAARSRAQPQTHTDSNTHTHTHTHTQPANGSDHEHRNGPGHLPARTEWSNAGSPNRHRRDGWPGRTATHSLVLVGRSVKRNQHVGQPTPPRDDFGTWPVQGRTATRDAATATAPADPPDQ